MFSEPVVGEKFFGREEVLELLRRRVFALKEGYRQNVALTGQSLAGKTSILHHFLYMAKEEGFIPVCVEVVKEPFSAFASKFIATLLYNALSKRGAELSIELNSLVETSQKFFPKTSASARLILSFIEKGQVDEAYSGLLNLTSVLRQESSIPCVVILDEFDNLECLGIKNPFANFGKVIMVQKDTMYIVSSSRNHIIKKILSEKLSLLFGNFEIVRVSSFDLAEADRYIRMMLGGFDLDDGMRKFLIAFTDGNPFYLSKIVVAIKNKAIGSMTTAIDRDMVAGIITALMYDATGVIHQYLLNYILELLDSKSKETALNTLIAIASGKSKVTQLTRALKVKSSELSKILLTVLELGLVSKRGNCYIVDDPVLGYWLKNVYQRKKSFLIHGAFDKMEIYKKEVTGYIDSYVAELSRSASARIAELMNHFGDDLVEIEHKNIRLPHFTRTESRRTSDGSDLVIGTYRGSSWVMAAYDSEVMEGDILNFIRQAKMLNLKVSQRVIVAARGIDEHAMLLAKELRIAVWDLGSVNMLFTLYGLNRMVPL